MSVKTRTVAERAMRDRMGAVYVDHLASRHGCFHYAGNTMPLLKVKRSGGWARARCRFWGCTWLRWERWKP